MSNDRVASYLASGRNSDMPELVRRWLAEGEGESQDEFLGIDVSQFYELPHWSDRPCGCCKKPPVDGPAKVPKCTVRWVLAESEFCHLADGDMGVCMSCSEAWTEAREALLRRTQSPGPNKVRQALIHLTSAQSQMLDTDDAIIREHIEAAVKLLEEAS